MSKTVLVLGVNALGTLQLVSLYMGEMCSEAVCTDKVAIARSNLATNANTIVGVCGDATDDVIDFVREAVASGNAVVGFASTEPTFSRLKLVGCDPVIRTNQVADLATELDRRARQ